MKYNISSFHFSFVISIAAHLTGVSLFVFMPDSMRNQITDLKNNQPLHFVLYHSDSEGQTAEQNLIQKNLQSPKAQPLMKSNVEKLFKNDIAQTALIEKNQISTSVDSETANSEKAFEQTSEQNNDSSRDLMKNGSQAGQLARSAEEIYIAEIKQVLNRKKKYPVLAKKMGQSGSVKIKFEINKNGEIISSAIIEPSEFQSLNDSVISMLKEIKNFKPIPTEINKTSWVFALPVDYKL